MKDKVQLIKEEIERLKKESLEGKKDYYDYYDGVGDACNEMLQFIDSLPEEPTGEAIKENYNERYKRITQTEQFRQSYCDKSLGKEEPASEDLEEEIERCWKEIFPIGYSDTTLLALTHEQHKDFARHFAEWQKQKSVQDFLEKAEMYLRYRVYYNTHPNNINVAIDDFKNYMQNEI